MKGLFLSSSSLLDVILAQDKDDNSISSKEQHSELGPKNKRILDSTSQSGVYENTP